ncbi:phage terminase large subunit [Paracoccus denitrificans]|uniref:phage terminase large subunit n=1 Tax=Paracoccus denitrificans TaxID=266 RepID=UPI001E4E63BD|nr:phage terminase large subunit [Paracoccus denitrificans]UFS67865.1 phage terminase large subunit [Paracoccus denitrificans]
MSRSQSTSDPLADDFKVFLYLLWNHLGLPEPTRSQFIMADWLQNGPRRLVIEAFRGIGKSWVTAAFVCWLLYRDPQLKIMVVSASKNRADDFSTFVLRLIEEVPFLQHLRPREGQRSSKISFDVGPARADQSPSVKSVGITGQLTGSRADVIIADDIEVTGNSATQTMRDRLKELIKEFSAVLKPLETSRILYLGTPQTEQSIYNALPERGYEIRVIPVQYPTQAQRARYGTRLAAEVVADLERDPTLVGQPFCTRFNADVIQEKLAEYGTAGFALQFMLDTSLADADRYPLKLRDLIVMDLDRKRAPVSLAWGSDTALSLSDVPTVGFDGDRFYKPFHVSQDWSEYTGIVMAVDPSGRGGDETSYAIVAFLHGRLFVLDVGGFRGGYEDSTLEAICHRAKEYGANEVIIEPNFGDGMFLKLLAPHMARIHPCKLSETDRSTNQKELRIVDTLEPVMNQHRLVIDKHLILRDYESTTSLPPEQQNIYRLFFQITRITRDRGALKKDDRIDALALAVHYWTKQLAQDTEKAAEQARTEALERELEVFLQHVMGGAPEAPSLIQRVI